MHTNNRFLDSMNIEMLQAIYGEIYRIII